MDKAVDFKTGDFPVLKVDVFFIPANNFTCDEFTCDDFL